MKRFTVVWLVVGGVVVWYLYQRMRSLVVVVPGNVAPSPTTGLTYVPPSQSFQNVDTSGKIKQPTVPMATEGVNSQGIPYSWLA